MHFGLALTGDGVGVQAGDWALDRYGAIFLQGTEGVVLDGCTLGALMPLPLGPHPAFDER